jgi:hypothetical protein
LPRAADEHHFLEQVELNCGSDISHMAILVST